MRRAPASLCGDLLGWGEAELREASATPRLDAEVLLAHSTGFSRASLLAFPERTLASGERTAFEQRVRARAAGVPVAYLTGRKEFYALPLKITPAVLVPRPETELLVDQVLARLPAERPCRVLDLGTGSGAIALAVKAGRPLAEVVASDLEPAALALARDNAARLGLAIEWRLGDWCDALEPAERFDLIASNPPYVEREVLVGALAHEPRPALDGGRDGLDPLRKILATAPDRLVPGGWLVLEHGATQRAALAELAAATPGLVRSAGYADLAGHDRVLALEFDL